MKKLIFVIIFIAILSVCGCGKAISDYDNSLDRLVLLNQEIGELAEENNQLYKELARKKNRIRELEFELRVLKEQVDTLIKEGK